MKNYLFILFCATTMLFSCEKEYSFENHNADGNLKESNGNCFSISKSGSFVRGTTLTDSNYLQVQVNIKRRGYYTVYTPITNGFSFLDSGYITEGRKTITLKGKGKPDLSGTTLFAIIFGKDTCYYPLTVLASPGDPANFAIVNCESAKTEGEYKVNAALTSSNKIILQVNVTTIGAYDIGASANGIAFSAQGNFTATGLHQVTLAGSGIPTSTGLTKLNFVAGSSACAVSIDVQPIRVSALNSSDTAWSFNVGDTKYFGAFDQAFTSGLTGSKFLYLKGITVSGDSAMSISIQLSGSTVEPGTYLTRTNPHFTFKDRYALTENIYRADPSTTTVEMRVIIASFNAVTGLIQGTFTGTAISKTGTVNITSGRFNAEVD